jgi:hypothetical protein
MYIGILLGAQYILHISRIRVNKHFCSGGSGFLGQHIVQQLQENDPKVREIRILDLIPYVNYLGKQTYFLI